MQRADDCTTKYPGEEARGSRWDHGIVLVGTQGGQRWDAAFAGLFQRPAMVSITLVVCVVAEQLLSGRQPELR